MRPVRPIVVIEAFPDRQLLLEVHIPLVREELVELVLVGPMRPLDLSVQLGRSRFDVDVFHAFVCNVPVEERLELVAAIRADRLDPKRELLNDEIDEVDGTFLDMSLQGPVSRSGACVPLAAPYDSVVD